MLAMLRVTAYSLIFLFVTSVAMAQVATGTYPYGTYDTLGLDTINVGNLNVHLNIPVLNKPGRGIPFSYILSYDSSVWAPAVVNGSQAWTPAQNFGWRGVTEIATGFVSFNEATHLGRGIQTDQGTIFCTTTSYSGFVYHDTFGVQHIFPLTLIDTSEEPEECNPQPSVSSGTATATDGSGYTISVVNFNQATLTSTTGKQIQPPSSTSAGPGTAIDSNGNEISTDGNGNFTDTTGNIVLTVTGSAPSPQILTYKDAAGTPRHLTVTYGPHTVQTAFGCGIGEYGPTATSLIDSIQLADGSTYTFSYEATPNGSGNVTGRLASITLPQGGLINYTYSGGNNGIECTDGSAAGLTRTISADSGSAASTWAYTRPSIGTGTSTTTVVDGLGNHKTYTFVEASNQPTGAMAQYYETSRTVYQGPGGTPVLARNTCYDQTASPCSTSAFTLPISQIDTYETLNGSETHGVTAIYNTLGLQTEADVYDFGSGLRGPLLRRENWTYGAGIAGLVTEDDVFDGSGALSGQTLYGYDQATPVASSGVPQHLAIGNAGNLTGLTQYASAGTPYSSSAAYEDTGSLLTSTTPNGTTTYSYDPTFVYTTSVSLPTPSSGVALSASATFDTTNTGLSLSSTDPNGKITTIPSYDPLLRPTEVDYPDGGKTTWSYSPTTVTTSTLQTLSVSATSEVQLDGYGRTSRTEAANGQSGNSFYQQDTCYDANGNVAFSSYRYQGTGFGASKVCSGNGDASTYDVLGRVTQVTRGNGETLHYTYWGRATQSVDQNGVTRIMQTDGLGRPVKVCEITSNPLPGSGSPVSCGTDIAGTGFVTSYSYALATPTTTISQGGQTRTFVTDWLGRATSVTEPESGTTTYSYAYNSTGLVVTRNRPKANQINPSVQTTTTSQFDSLGRLVSVNYSDGTPAKQYLYDANGGFAAPQSNLKGRLSRATASTSPTFSGTVFSYDAVGRIIGLSECFPWTCGTPGDDKNLLYTYDLAGNLTSSTDGNNVMTSYSYSPAGEVQGITSSLSDSNHPGTLLSNVQNGPFGPISYTLGNGIAQVNTYDGLGRPNAGSVCPSAPGSIGCSGQIYGFSTTWQGTQLKSSTDTVTGNFNYTYDEFNRLAGTANASGPFYTYIYDRWGNRTSQTPSQGGFSFVAAFNANNQVNQAGFTYDAAGNLTSDGTNSYVYDAEGNVIQQGTLTYIYDALNREVGQGFGGSIGSGQAFDKDGNFASLWLVNSGSLSFIGGKAYWNGRALEYYNSSTAFFEHRDWVGTRRATTNSAATVTNVRTSLPFGDGAANVSGGQDNTFDGYTGLWNGGSSASNHAQFRDYWNVAGRWLQPDPDPGSYDPSNPQSFNRYAYVLNNPVRFVDPLGLDTDEDACGIVGDDDGGDNCNSGIGDGGGGGGGGDSGSGGAPYCISGCGRTDNPPDPPHNPPADPPPPNPITELPWGLQSPPNLPAPSNRTTCTGSAMFTGVGGNQAMANGALYSQYPKQAGGSIRGGTFGTVAVQNGFLGLSTRQLRTYGTQIFITPSNQGLFSQYGGPTGPLSVSDYGDANIQATSGVAFDVYRFPTVSAGMQFGRRTMSTTISFPNSSGASCPAGFTVVP